MTMNSLPRMGLLALAVTMIVGMGAAEMVEPSNSSYELQVGDSIPVEADLNLSNYENMSQVDDITVTVDEENTNNTFTVQTESTDLWQDIKDGVNDLFGTQFSVTTESNDEIVTVEGEVDRSTMEDEGFDLLNNDVTVETLFEQIDSDGNVTENESFSETVTIDIPAVEITSPEADSEVEVAQDETTTVETAFNDDVEEVSATLDKVNGETIELLGDDANDNTVDVSNASVELGLDDLEGEGTVIVEGYDVDGTSIENDSVTFTLSEETSIFDNIDETTIDGDFSDSSGGLVGVGIVLLVLVLGGVVAYRRFM